MGELSHKLQYLKDFFHPRQPRRALFCWGYYIMLVRKTQFRRRKYPLMLSLCENWWLPEVAGLGNLFKEREDELSQPISFPVWFPGPTEHQPVLSSSLLLFLVALTVFWILCNWIMIFRYLILLFECSLFVRSFLSY